MIDMQENECTGAMTLAYREIDASKELIELIDHLIETRHQRGLELVAIISSKMLQQNVWTGGQDLLSIGEYAEYAAQFLGVGKTSAEILAGGYRKRAVRD